MRFRLLLLLTFASISTLTAISQAAPKPESATPTKDKPAQVRAHGPHLESDNITLPLTIVKGYPFIEGSIHGTKGKLMFDVGEAPALVIDSHTVTPPNGKVVGNGFFGSGQTYDVYRFPVIDSLALAAGLHYETMTDINGNPGIPIEQHITPLLAG